MNPTDAIAWQVAWPLSPAVVGITAAIAVGAILATTTGWRPAAARGGVVVLLVVMCSGLHRVAPPSLQASAAGHEPTPPHLVDCVVPAVAWMGESLTVEAVAEVAAPAQQPSADPPVVELLDSQGEVLSTASLEPGDHSANRAVRDGQLWRARLPWQPREAGVQQLAVRWGGLRRPSQAATSSFAARSSAIPAVCGVAAGPLRVLLIDSVARWETRHLQRLLTSSEGIEPTQVVLEADASGALPRSRQAAAEYDAVVLGSFDPRDLPEATVEAIVETGGEGLAVACDLTDADAADRVVAATVERFGGIDLLVNNAGGGGHVPTKYGADEHFEAAIGLNFRAPFYLTRAVAPHMRSRGDGAVVNVSSGFSRAAHIGSIPYGGAKAALEQMTRMMAMEFAPEIRVNAIRVGAVTTENMRENLLARNPGIGEKLEAWTPRARLGEPLAQFPGPVFEEIDVTGLFGEPVATLGNTLLVLVELAFELARETLPVLLAASADLADRGELAAQQRQLGRDIGGTLRVRGSVFVRHPLASSALSRGRRVCRPGV